jgi:hypothetical protein
MPDDTADLRKAASAALDRAHLAAAAADGGKLRRALEDAAEALDGTELRDAAYKVRAALADLEKGQLVELEILLEDARRSLAG